MAIRTPAHADLFPGNHRECARALYGSIQRSILRRTMSVTPIAADQASRLQRLNVIAAIAHLAQGVLVLLLATREFDLPVTTNFWTGPPTPGIDPSRIGLAFEVPVAWGAALFLFLSALFHGIVATVGRRRYLTELAHHRNRFRWVEYSLSSTLMIVLIAMVFGISEIAALVGLAGANAAMILFGWIMEVVNTKDSPVRWTPFWFGCIAGVVPWVALGIYTFGPTGAPGFVYGIAASIFVFFNLFALNQWLQYRAKGRFADYLYGERVYLWLSLTAKAALAWQIFGNTLAG